LKAKYGIRQARCQSRGQTKLLFSSSFPFDHLASPQKRVISALTITRHARTSTHRNKGLSDPADTIDSSRADYGRALPTFSRSSFFDEWPSETTLSPGNERIERERWPELHPSSLPPFSPSPPPSNSPRGTTRSIFYRITGIVASAPLPLRCYTLAAVTAERCSRPRPSASHPVRAERHSTRIKY